MDAMLHVLVLEIGMELHLVLVFTAIFVKNFNLSLNKNSPYREEKSPKCETN